MQGGWVTRQYHPVARLWRLTSQVTSNERCLVAYHAPVQAGPELRQLKEADDNGAELQVAADGHTKGQVIAVHVGRHGGMACAGSDVGEGPERVEEEEEGPVLDGLAGAGRQEAADVAHGFVQQAPGHELLQMLQAQVRVRLLDHRLEGGLEALLGEVGEDQPVPQPPRAGVLHGSGELAAAATAAVHLHRRHVAGSNACRRLLPK